MDFLKKFGRYLIYGIFVLGFVWVSAQLFLEKQTNALLTSVVDYFESGDEVTNKLEHLRIVYPDVPQSLEPTVNDPSVRQRINNIYEPLLRADRDLTMRSSLALSWGMVDEITWDFTLRSNVLFHDGSSFEAKDVVASINRAKNYKDSQLLAVLASIKDVQIVDDFKVRIKTFEPDPLLLQRLSMVLIIPSEYEKDPSFAPVGTGSYEFVDSGDSAVLSFKRFDNYWGKKAKFAKVDAISEPDKNSRVGMFLADNADFLAFVPFDAASVLKDKGVDVVGIPSLEVQFLIFNVQSKNLSDVLQRKAFSLAIDQKSLAESLGAYAHPVSQFVSNGVFGFNPDIPAHNYDLNAAANFVDKSGLKGETLRFHLPKGLSVLGEHVRKQLSDVGVHVVVSYLEPDAFFASLIARDADLYFLGYKADLGDSGDFLDSIVHSDAEFNVSNYSNKDVDRLIDDSLKQLDPSLRIADLQEAMRAVVVDDVIGVPLFEYETLYAFSDKLNFEPRIDGSIYFDELIIK